MAVLLITHDLGVVANVAEEIVVMYRGEIMESGTLDDIFRRPEHPYLKALLRAVPRFDMKPGERLVPMRDIPPGDAPHLMAEQRPGRPMRPARCSNASISRRASGCARAGFSAAGIRAAGGRGRRRSASRSSAASASASSARAAAARPR